MVPGSSINVAEITGYEPESDPESDHDSDEDSEKQRTREEEEGKEGSDVEKIA